jgi:hypothetical protein
MSYLQRAVNFYVTLYVDKLFYTLHREQTEIFRKRIGPVRQSNKDAKLKPSAGLSNVDGDPISANSANLCKRRNVIGIRTASDKQDPSYWRNRSIEAETLVSSIFT